MEISLENLYVDLAAWRVKYKEIEAKVVGSGCSDLLKAVPPVFKQYHPTSKRQNQYPHLLESKLEQMLLS